MSKDRRERGRITSFERDGLTFDVHDEGPLEGDVVVLLHGFPERATSWRDVAPLLHEHGYRTLAPDQRGYSPGARPSRRRDYRVTELSDDVVALVDLVGAPVHLVGHDWGAIVAWTLALRRPELLLTLTALSVPHPTAFLRALVTSPQPLRSWYVLLFQLPGVPELSARRPGGIFEKTLEHAGMTPDEVARCRDEVIDDGALSGALGWYRAMPFADRRLLGTKVTVPTTLVWSDGDVALDRRGAELTERYVDAPYRFVELTDVTHWIPTQAPEACAAAILDRLAA